MPNGQANFIQNFSYLVFDNESDTFTAHNTDGSTSSAGYTTTNIVYSPENTPAPGFTRYDDTANADRFKFNNMSVLSNGDTANFFNGNMHYGGQNSSVCFVMNGTRFYLLNQCYDGDSRNKNNDL